MATCRRLLDSPPLQIFALALALRLLVAVLTANLYDPDEFVYLTLARAVAHGAVPYRDFVFFHPPGFLIILRALNPLITLWWPSARIAGMLVDSLTAVVVWRLGRQLYGRKEALAAGLIYAANPVAMITSVRVLQEPYVTFAGVAALTLLLARRSVWSAAGAGILVGIAVWIKYPALIFLGAGMLANPRRVLPLVAAAAATIALLFAPEAALFHRFWSDTVLWQLSRPAGAFSDRLRITVSFLVLANPLVLFAWRERRWFLWFGYAAGAVFLLASHTYYHYFLLSVPFAALLGAPVAVRVLRVIRNRYWVDRLRAASAGLAIANRHYDTQWGVGTRWSAGDSGLTERGLRISRREIAAAALALATLWGAGVGLAGPGTTLVSSAALSTVAPVARYLDRLSHPGQAILGDRFEYAFLAGRVPYDDYYWNLVRSIRPRHLEADLDARAVVRTGGEWQSFPPGLVHYLSRHYPHFHVGTATVWDVARRRDHEG